MPRDAAFPGCARRQGRPALVGAQRSTGGDEGVTQTRRVGKGAPLQLLALIYQLARRAHRSATAWAKPVPEPDRGSLEERTQHRPSWQAILPTLRGFAQSQ